MKKDLIIEHGRNGIVKLKFEYNGNKHSLAEYNINTDESTIKKDKYTPYSKWNEMVQYVENFENTVSCSAHIHELLKEIDKLKKEIADLQCQICEQYK